MLQDAICVDKTKLLVNYLHHCKDELYLYDLASGKQLYKFPLEIGTILELNCKYNQDFVSQNKFRELQVLIQNVYLFSFTINSAHSQAQETFIIAA